MTIRLPLFGGSVSIEPHRTRTATGVRLLKIGGHTLIWRGAEPGLCMLHIGKTGGTALKAVFSAYSQQPGSIPLELFGNSTTLPEILKQRPRARVIMFVRDPISRFVSGFNSRLRKGQPRILKEWSEDEKAAFSTFGTPNALAEALSDPAMQEDAEHAMRSIQHVRETLVHYLNSVTFLEANRERIFFVGLQERLDADLARLGAKLNMGPGLHTPNDAISAHRTPEGMDTRLSHRARENLSVWYAADYPIFRWCERWQEA